MARSSVSALPHSASRTVARRPPAGGPRQLSLFGPTHPALELSPARAAQRPPAAPAAPPVVRGPADRPEAVFLRRLNRLTQGKIHAVILTDNRRTILSVRPVRGSSSIDLRIHRCFGEAPDDILESVATFVLLRKGSEGSRASLAHLREHFTRHQAAVPRKQRRLSLEPLGATCDLRQVAAELNREYFGGRLKVDITWGKASVGPAHCHRGRTATLQLGSYSYEDRLIRIHRVLDRDEVPRYVLEAVVYHELLHAALPPVLQGGRRQYHTPEFRRRERLFASFQRADRWVQQNLPTLLKARRKRRG